MNRINFKSFIPHLIAIGVFLLVAVIFCKPALQGNVIAQQGDLSAVESMRHQSDLYKEQHGNYPLWITSMFSGMPAYNIIFEGPWSPFSYVNQAMQLWLPKPLNFFFLSCICFYIMCLCLKIRPYVGILASLAFAYATYNPILAIAGHDTKILALAYAPALLGGIFMLFDKKYISGFVVTALFANMELMQNHQQITYYLFLIIGVMSIFYLVRWLLQKEFAHIFKAFSLALLAASIGILINAILILPVYDYAKYSKRGGQLVLDNKIDNKTNRVEKDKTSGLSREYAFQWSNEKMEALSIMFPSIYGYGAYFSQRDGEYNIFPKLEDDSHVSSYLVEKLNMGESQAADIAANLSGRIYWGGKPFTMGPAYLGAIICFLFILSMFVLDNKNKWWIFSASLLGVLLSMGKYLPGFNNFLFDYLPFYNKFRTPEMSLIIPQLLFPLSAALTVNFLLDNQNENTLKKFKWGAIATGIVFIIAGAFYLNLDYGKENKQRTQAVNAAYARKDANLNNTLQNINSKYEAESDNKIYEEFLSQTNGDQSIAKGLLNALHEDRQGFFKNDIMHALLLIILAGGLLALFLLKKINGTLLSVGLSILIVFDLLSFDMHYLNENSFESSEKYEASKFTPTATDNMILADKDPNFRIFDLAGGDPFQDATPSYYHKSIGGYHPAKIGIYDDLITYQLSNKLNPGVINMLNAKYIIQKSADGKETTAYPNTDALGNCWFVKGVKFVNGPANEMRALDNFSPKDTAIIDQSFSNIIHDFSATDSNASIKQTAFDNMAISYVSNSTQNNVAVFSEIFFKDWHAYLDGKQVPYAKANYVLRSMVIPAGKHNIEFKFEPEIFNLSYKASVFGIWLLVTILLSFVFYTIKQLNPSKQS